MKSIAKFCKHLFSDCNTILKVLGKLLQEEGYPASEREFGKRILNWVYSNLSKDGTLSFEKVPGLLKEMGVKYDHDMDQDLSAPQQLIHYVVHHHMDDYAEDRPSAITILAGIVSERILDPGSLWILKGYIYDVEDYLCEHMFLSTAVSLGHFDTLLHRDDAMHIDRTRLKGRLADFKDSSPKKVRDLIARVNAL